MPARSRLMERLNEETGSSSGQQRLTLVCTPTGYGKTRTIAEWLGADGDESVIWVHCDQASPSMLWPTLAHELAPFSSANLHEAGDPISDTLRLAKHLETPLTLIVDDYHHSSDAQNDIALADLSAATPLLTLVISARRVALLDGPLVSARTRVRVVGPEDLALTNDEALQLAASLGIPPSERLSNALEEADGWPLAIRAALELGSDALYLSTPDPTQWNSSSSAPHFDPLENLHEFALDHLQLLSPTEREVILAAAALDALSLKQITETLGVDLENALAATQRLCELGLLWESRVADMSEFRCHRSVKSAFNSHLLHTATPERIRQIYRDRANELVEFSPFTAFTLYCQAEDFDHAELTLARNFTTLTDETDTCARHLKQIPEDLLLEHPTFTAGLLFLEIPRSTVAPPTLDYLVGVWRDGLLRRMPNGIPSEPGPLSLPLLAQAMVLSRMLGKMDESHKLLQHLEGRLSPDLSTDDTVEFPSQRLANAVTEHARSLPHFLREAASTSLMVGDFPSARRSLTLLRGLSERKKAKPWVGFPRASIRTVTDIESGSNWLVTALGEMAFTEMLDGDMRASAHLLAEMDAHIARTKAQAPGISWAGAEIARAHLAYETGNEALLEAANSRLTPLSDRLEAWPLLLIAQSNALRSAQGAEYALTHLHSTTAMTQDSLRVRSRWSESLAAYEAMLRTLIGDVSGAALVLTDWEDSVRLRVERARLALYLGNDVEAMLIAQQIGDPEATKRQRTDRSVIGSVAAWACGQTEDAFCTFSQVATYLKDHALPSSLWGVPHQLLRELALAARDAGVCDIVDIVDEIPEAARTRRYERLTEMELRTLEAIAEHRNASGAATSLFVTAGTVKKHLASVYRKLGAKGRDEAILYARRMGLLAEPSSEQA